jgi:hypothetical protein
MSGAFPSSFRRLYYCLTKRLVSTIASSRRDLFFVEAPAGVAK